MATTNLIDFTELDNDIQELIRDSRAARLFAYSPYSKFKVGAAIRCDDGTISRGCNVENASYPVSICAERIAIARAVSDGRQKFKALAVTADSIEGTIPTPCGMCRQALSEFGDIPIYLTSPDVNKVYITSLVDLLPKAFALNKNG